MGILPDHVGNRACHRRSRIVCRREIYRRPGARGILFALIVIASAAQSFRSTCGCEREAPACSKQRFPEATRHVGQGTARNISGTKSLISLGQGAMKHAGKLFHFEHYAYQPSETIDPTGRLLVRGLPANECTQCLQNYGGHPMQYSKRLAGTSEGAGEYIASPAARSRTFNTKAPFPD